MAKCRRCGTPAPGRAQLCDPCRGTSSKTEPETPIAPDIPAGLHRRGRALWVELGVKSSTPLGELAYEACRTADRLDELDRIISGKGVFQLMTFRLDHIDWDPEGDQHIHVKVGFQSVLSESRLQQIAFKDMLKEIRAAAAATTNNDKPSSIAAEPTKPASVLDELAARRGGREQTAT